MNWAGVFEKSNMWALRQVSPALLNAERISDAGFL